MMAETATDILSDLNERLDRGIAYLNEKADEHPDSRDRIAGKAQGLALVKDWLRSYKTTDG